MSSTTDTREFQTEARKMLDLVIHSIYSNKEIFLRELISNASDALDKLRFEALTRTDLAHLTGDLHIRLEVDKEARVLTVHDNGMGMSRDEVVEYIGTIARSGTREYLEALRQGETPQSAPELIGQFGVGFYSCFMVADRVVLTTRRAGEETAWEWESTGDGTYSLKETKRAEPGTSVSLQLKPADAEDGLEDFSDPAVLRRIVKRYSDFVAYPIRMKTERREVERDKEGRAVKGAIAKTVTEEETLNSMKAIWTRPESEVSEEEFREFYKHISHDWNDPLARVSYRAEGASEFRALLFLPSRAPLPLFLREEDWGIHLYVRRVFIMHDCRDLIPPYLRFVRGVVDSEDLSLNISREMLQQNRHIQVIRKALVRKTLDWLGSLRGDAQDKYRTFWEQFGPVLKEGLFQDDRNREKILDLCLFRSTRAPEQWTSLEEYTGRMKPDQDAIYYLCGESLETLRDSPHLEAFGDKGYEVLLLTDPVDEIWLSTTSEFKSKSLLSVGRGGVEPGTAEEREKAQAARKEQESAYKALLESLGAKLEAHVREVRLSSRLTSSPACLVGDAHDLSPRLEQFLRASGQKVPSSKRILEVNPGHPVVRGLRALFEKNPQDPRLDTYAHLLYGQAVLAEGGTPANLGEFSRRMAELMSQALGAESGQADRETGSGGG